MWLLKTNIRPVRASIFNITIYNFPGGKIIIGSGTADQKLSVNGNASKTGRASWLTFSDNRLKQNTSAYIDGLAAVLKINPVGFSTTMHRVTIHSKSTQAHWRKRYKKFLLIW